MGLREHSGASKHEESSLTAAGRGRAGTPLTTRDQHPSIQTFSGPAPLPAARPLASEAAAATGGRERKKGGRTRGPKHILPGHRPSCKEGRAGAGRGRRQPYSRRTRACAQKPLDSKPQRGRRSELISRARHRKTTRGECEQVKDSEGARQNHSRRHTEAGGKGRGKGRGRGEEVLYIGLRAAEREETSISPPLPLSSSGAASSGPKEERKRRWRRESESERASERERERKREQAVQRLYRGCGAAPFIAPSREPTSDVQRHPPSFLSPP